MSLAVGRTLSRVQLIRRPDDDVVGAVRVEIARRQSDAEAAPLAVPMMERSASIVSWLPPVSVLAVYQT